jgi:hypothetical protein
MTTALSKLVIPAGGSSLLDAFVHDIIQGRYIQTRGGFSRKHFKDKRTAFCHTQTLISL